MKQAVEVYKQAIQHQGFAYIDTFSPCVTFNKVNTAAYYKENIVDINAEGHDTSDLQAAHAQALREDGIATGILYQNVRSCYEATEEETLATPICDHELGIDTARGKELCSRFQ